MNNAEIERLEGRLDKFEGKIDNITQDLTDIKIKLGTLNCTSHTTDIENIKSKCDNIHKQTIDWNALIRVVIYGLSIVAGIYGVNATIPSLGESLAQPTSINQVK